MTSHDDIVSAYLDGEATPEERARVEGDPVLLERLAQLRAATELVAEPPPTRPDVRDHLVARAVAATPEGAVADLAAARERRRRRVRALSIAAAVLLVALAVPLLANLGGDDGPRDLATAPTETDEPLDETDEAAPQAAAPAAPPELGDSDAAAGATGRVGPPGEIDEHLGLFTTRQEVRGAVTDAVDRILAATEATEAEAAEAEDATELLDRAPATGGDQPDCVAAVLSLDPELDQLLYRAGFDFDGEAHVVYLFGLSPDSAANGAFRLVEVTLATCVVFEVQTL